MADQTAEKTDRLQTLHLALFLIGGACAGTGIVNLLGAFGAPSGDMNQNFAVIGADALDNIGAGPTFDFAIPLVVVGVLCLIFANAIAWRKTGGY